MNAVADIGSDQADLDPSTDRYAQRFQGAAGEWLLSRQTHALRTHLKGESALNILDVGGGHAQVARPLCADGHRVTVHASSQDALGQVLKFEHPNLTQSVGALRQLPFEDQSFDVVTSFRIMAHIGDWQPFLTELLRVARKTIVIDFPIPGGVNALEPLLFGLKKRIEGNTRKFDTMTRPDVRHVIESAGWTETAAIGQFVLPMVLHRKLSVPTISAALEGGLAALGLAGAVGTPVVLRADRNG